MEPTRTSPFHKGVVRKIYKKASPPPVKGESTSNHEERETSPTNKMTNEEAPPSQGRPMCAKHGRCPADKRPRRQRVFVNGKWYDFSHAVINDDFGFGSTSTGFEKQGFQKYDEGVLEPLGVSLKVHPKLLRADTLVAPPRAHSQPSASSQTSAISGVQSILEDISKVKAVSTLLNQVKLVEL
ncbi:hypothetical protein Cni_G15905 [Canna indica]|uniref:Uncharacterized protein n=1 Tax=Canna indica TaxID=4628 RepID=A0AAQ3KEL8_9LILI|nr:hypothetical protein Cni_G15905 [Canna indica]